MDMKIATTSTFHQWVAHHSSSLSPSIVSTPSKQRSIVNHIRSLSSRYTKTQFIRRAFSTNVDPSFSEEEEEFSRKMQELSLKFQVSNDILGSSHHHDDFSTMEPPWHDTVQMSRIERRANSVELPLSLRIIKRKLKMEEEVVIKHHVDGGDESSAVKKAFTVHSIGTNSALAAATPPTADEKLDSSVIMTFSVSSLTGGGSGGNNIPPVQSATHGDGSDKFRMLSQFSSSSSLDATSADSDVSASGQEEVRLWNSILEESERMGALDHETMKQMVSPSPVEARVEAEESMDYFKTELLYQTGLSQPDNVLLLANYAQFLYLIIHDYDRAEKYFKRAAKAEPADAEALNKYATFLWKARNDVWRAEETFLEAISADPTNSFYSANYAHFLWNTGGDETCFPLDAPPQQNTT
ncbi:hypothetical protein Bca101_008533 [Brassica carinata]